MEYHDHPDFFPSISAVTEEGPGPILLHFGGAVVTGPLFFSVLMYQRRLRWWFLSLWMFLEHFGLMVLMFVSTYESFVLHAGGTVLFMMGQGVVMILLCVFYPEFRSRTSVFLAIYILTSLTMIGAYYLYYIHCVIYTQSLFALAEWTNVFNNIIFQYSLFRTCFTGTDYYRTLSGTFRELPV